MEMYNKELESQISEVFSELHKKVEEIIETSKTYKIASERITNTIASRIVTESEGYIVDLYTSLVDDIKKEDYFKNPNHLNDFYRLNLREELNEKYNFDITSLDTYKKGIEFDEINNLYVTAGAAAGTLAVGGILKFAISGIVNIPLIVIVAGAVAVALVVNKAIPIQNKNEFKRVVDKFLKDMKSEILDWLEDVADYFQSRVNSLRGSTVK